MENNCENCDHETDECIECAEQIPSAAYQRAWHELRGMLSEMSRDGSETSAIVMQFMDRILDLEMKIEGKGGIE